VLTVLDIGSRGGPDPRWFPLGGAVEIVGVDADPEECARLNQQTFPIACRFLQAALGRRDGTEAVLHVTRQPGCSSVLEPNTDFLSQFPYGEAFTVVRRLPVTLTSLDTLCAAHEVRPHVVKIDTQGYELEILRGGQKALSSALLVELEVEFNPIYRDQPLFGDLDAELRRAGFSLLGLRRTAWRRTFLGPSMGGTVVHGDALYYREAAPADRVDKNRLALALTAYRQGDFARSLGVPISPARTRRLMRWLVALASCAWSHRELRRYLDRARPDGARDWHDPDFF
jgi:FkbM family methyltransferase